MPSFDIVSKVEWAEIDNALNQAQREIGQRFDFKDTSTEVEKNADGISVRSSSEDRARAAISVVHDKLVKRKVSLKHLDEQKVETTSKGGARVLIKIKEGIDVDNGKKIVKLLKDQKLKVQAAIQDAQVRVTGKSRDELQGAIAAVKGAGLPLELQFINFRD